MAFQGARAVRLLRNAAVAACVTLELLAAGCAGPARSGYVATPPEEQGEPESTATPKKGPEPAPADGEQPLDVERAIHGYLEGNASDGRRVGGPTDIDVDLDTSFPKLDSVFPSLIPKGYFAWKEKLYENTGIKLGISYQSLAQVASDTIRTQDYAWGGWLLIEAKWEAINRGEHFEGSLVVTLDWRHTIAGANPALFGTVDVGSLWPTDLAFFKFDLTVATLYWEQWFDKDRFVLRVGKQLAAQIYDFFRFKDARVSFSSDPFAGHTSIPAPPFALGISFEWWPIEGSELYVVGTLNDMNGSPTQSIGDMFDTFFKGQFFYGLEIGYFWKRNGLRDFDHLHVDFFWADRRQAPPGAPNEAGGGFKVLGSRQMKRIVAFGSYTFNTARGGGLGATIGRHTVTAGVSLLKPAGIRGEASLGLVWMKPLNNTVRDQFGSEIYWRILLTPSLWVTPGAQFIVNPSFNPTTDFIAIFQFKFRLFF